MNGKNNGKTREKILIVDDSEMNRSILRDMLEDEYDILEAENGEEAIQQIRLLGDEISLILLDIIMPVMDGFEMLEIMNEKRWINTIPVIMISSEMVLSYVERAYNLGASDYINRPFEPKIVHRRVVNTIMLYAKQKKLSDLVVDEIYEKERSNELMIEILSHIVEFRNGESGQHVRNIHILTELFLKKLVEKTDRYYLPKEVISMVVQASTLHDIGKIAIPEKILNKPGRLTREEFEIIKTHAAIGADMLGGMRFNHDESLVKSAYEICRWHHERYDGGGYPDGLEGDAIPISAQVVSLADVYDALTSERVYKKAYSHEQALEMILEGECGAFNPILIECLKEVEGSIQKNLKMHVSSKRATEEVKAVTEQMLDMNDLSVSTRTLRLLENERIKYQFFAAMSQEVQFEYTMVPDVITVSTWGAGYLGIREIISNPGQNRELFQIVDRETVYNLHSMLRATTPENPIVEYKCRVRIKGRERWCKIIARAMWSPDEPSVYGGTIGKLVDMHEEYQQIADLEHLASHDLLTGLWNHTNAKRQIQGMIREKGCKPFALLILDLDDFKMANDQFGHMFGDNVLKYTAERIGRSIRSEDIAARVGGDEFLVAMECGANIERQVERVFRSMADQYDHFQISVSLGVALYPQDGTDYDTLFQCADRALYTAKERGRKRYVFYDDTMRDKLSVLSDIEP